MSVRSFYPVKSLNPKPHQYASESCDRLVSVSCTISDYCFVHWIVWSERHRVRQTLKPYSLIFWSLCQSSTTSYSLIIWLRVADLRQTPTSHSLVISQSGMSVGSWQSVHVQISRSRLHSGLISAGHKNRSIQKTKTKTKKKKKKSVFFI